MKRFRVVGFLFLCLYTAPSWGLTLDRPAGLERDIDFWRRVYTDISTRQGFVHDDRRLDIVYEIVELPAGTSDRARRKAARAVADRYSHMLTKLAKGAAETLTSDEQRVLGLWGEDADATTLREASRRVRFQLGQSDRFREGLIRSGAWDEYIRSILQATGVPEEIRFLPHVESSFNPLARSHVGAAGMWQFMPSTGRRYLRIDHVVDERLDPYKSSRAAALLMQHNYEVTRSWPLAITAYNHGAAGMRRAIRQVGTDDVERVVRTYRSRSFGFASRNFYVAFLAAADVASQYERHFGPLKRNPPDPSRVIELPDFVPASTLTVALGVDRATLSEWNPSLLRAVWDGIKYVPRGYALRVPPRGGTDPLAQLAAIPLDEWSQHQTPDLFHVVQRGETLSAIAPRYGARVADLVALNGLTSRHRIRAGQKLVLPAAAPGATEAVVDDGVYSEQAAAAVAEQTDAVTQAAEVVAAEVVASEAIAAAIADTPAPVLVEPEETTEAMPADAPVEVIPELKADPADYLVAEDGRIHVQDAESLGHFAEWLNVRASDLRRLNGFGRRSLIRVGQTLKLDFSRATREEFEQRRIAYHQAIQEQFFVLHRIAGTDEHVVRRGETVWVLAERRYAVPVWLLRQYNPDVDLALLRPGTRVVIPLLVDRDA